jgi:replicative DNA helicase
MTELMTSGHAVDIVTLAEEFSKHKEIESIGGTAYIAGLTDGLPRRPRITEYIFIVKEKAKLRRIMGVCADAIKKAEMQMTTAAAIVKEMGQGLKGIK